MARKRTRLFVGQIPDDGKLLASANGWEIYERTARSTAEYRTLKVVRMWSATSKANYHLGWCIATSKLTKSSELRLLRDYEPGVHAWVEGVLKDERFA